MEIRLKENKKVIVGEHVSVNYDRRQAKDEDGKMIVQLDKEGSEIWDIHINDKNFRTSNMILDCDLSRLEKAIAKHFSTHHSLKISKDISIELDEWNSILTLGTTKSFNPKVLPEWHSGHIISYLLASKEVTLNSVGEFEEVAERAVSAILKRMVK